MMVNSSSSSSNDSLLHPNSSSYSSSLPLSMSCLLTRPSAFIFTTFNINNIFLFLPLCTFIIYHGLQQWWKKRSGSSAAPMNHSDSFTYHMVAMEMIGVFGCIFYSCGVFWVDLDTTSAGILLFAFTWYGEVFFYVLTCVERYLAVVHPVTYLSLRRERGVRIRNITIGCVWLLSIAGMCLVMMRNFILVNFCLLILSLTITSFCSLSVLCVLIRPGPGEKGRGRERVDQSKLRAFYTIVAILGVLVLRFTGDLVYAVLYVLGGSNYCVIMTCLAWFNLPSSLVLPLLFLHREGKLPCWKKSTQQG